jgi:hypothetical protein
MRTLTSSIAVAVAAFAIPASAAAPAAAPVEVPAAASSQAAPVQASAALRQRAEDLIRLINGEATPAEIFAPSVLDKVPAARLSAIAAAVRGRYGRALAVGGIEAESPDKGQVLITFEQTQLPIGVGVEAAAPNLINALQL